VYGIGRPTSSGESNHLIQHKNKLEESQEEQIYLVCVYNYTSNLWLETKKKDSMN
jgi:hypothetical protein